MFAWNVLRRTRTWKTKLYFVIFAVQFFVSLVDYEATGYKSLGAWIVFVCSHALGEDVKKKKVFSQDRRSDKVCTE